MAFDVTVFTQDNCPNCVAAKQKLDEAKIAYKEVNIDSVDGRTEFLVQTSRQNATPAFVLDGAEVDTVEEIIDSYNKAQT